MNYSFDKLESIVLEEANVSAINNSYQTKHMFCIEPNGVVTETIFNNELKNIYYKADIKDIELLYNQLISFIDEIDNMDLYDDDCVKDIYLNYGLVSIKIPARCYNADKQIIGDIIDEFIKNNCIKTNK